MKLRELVYRFLFLSGKTDIAELEER